MDSLILALKVFTVSFVGIIISFIIISILINMRDKRKKKNIVKKDSEIRSYFNNAKYEGALPIIDETPMEVYVGDRFYLLRPLKYRQITRVCVLFAHLLEKLQTLDLDLNDADKVIGEVIEHSEEEFFKALSLILYFSEHPYEDNEKTIIIGAKEEFEYLKDNININELSRVLEVLIKQNDIQRALEAFGRVNSKKKEVRAT